MAARLHTIGRVLRIETRTIFLCFGCIPQPNGRRLHPSIYDVYDQVRGHRRPESVRSNGQW